MTAKYLLLLLDNKLAEFVSTCLTIVQSMIYMPIILNIIYSNTIQLIIT